MFFLGANAAGILNKKESFYRNMNLFSPSVFFLQETKTRFKNKLKYPNYTFFEYIRKNSGGGGLITAVHTLCFFYKNNLIRTSSLRFW